MPKQLICHACRRPDKFPCFRLTSRSSSDAGAIPTSICVQGLMARQEVLRLKVTLEQALHFNASAVATPDRAANSKVLIRPLLGTSPHGVNLT